MNKSISLWSSGNNLRIKSKIEKSCLCLTKNNSFFLDRRHFLATRSLNFVTATVNKFVFVASRTPERQACVARLPLEVEKQCSLGRATRATVYFCSVMVLVSIFNMRMPLSLCVVSQMFHTLTLCQTHNAVDNPGHDSTIRELLRRKRWQYSWPSRRHNTMLGFPERRFSAHEIMHFGK